MFDPKTIIDNATYDKPHQYATGVEFVIVNGSFGQGLTHRGRGILCGGRFLTGAAGSL